MRISYANSKLKNRITVLEQNLQKSEAEAPILISKLNSLMVKWL